MYRVPFTIVLCPENRLQASVGELSRLISVASGFASIVLSGNGPPCTPNCASGFMEMIGSMTARTNANSPNLINRVDIVPWLEYIAGAVTELIASSSSATDSQSLSPSSSFSPNTSLRLRNLTVLAGRRCLKVGALGAGLLCSFILSSSTNPTSVNIDRRRPSAGCGRTCSIVVKPEMQPSMVACRT